MSAEIFCLLAAGVFFLTGLLTGAWKYLAIHRSPKAEAPVYVDIAHRASLMYAFAAILMREFVPYSPFSDRVTLLAAGVPILFFALAIATYVIHGVLNDTDNQMRRPHVLGSSTLPGWMILGFMAALMVGEIGGFALLFWGFLTTVF